MGAWLREPADSGGFRASDHPSAEDLVIAADQAVEVLRPRVGADWTVPAGTLEWNVRYTLEHLAGCMTWYATHLVSQTTSFLGFNVRAREQVDNEHVLRMVAAAARLLATVAEAAPEGARGHHLAGMADATGFLAMACDEVLVHTSDAAKGLHLEYEPEPGLAAKVVGRLFPWAPIDGEPWATLLWANGRGSIPGHADVGPEWGWHCAPLPEWDGVVPRRMLVGLGFDWDPDGRRWRPATTDDDG